MSDWLKMPGLLAFTWCARLAWAETALKPMIAGFYLPVIRDGNLADIKLRRQVWADDVEPVDARAFDSYRWLLQEYRTLQQTRVARNK